MRLFFASRYIFFATLLRMSLLMWRWQYEPVCAPLSCSLSLSMCICYMDREFLLQFRFGVLLHIQFLLHRFLSFGRWSVRFFSHTYIHIYIRFAKPNVGLVTRCCCCRLYPLLFSPLPPYLKLLLLLLLLLALTTVVDVSPVEVDFSLHCAWMWIVEASDFSPFASNRKTHWWADEL